METPFEPSRQCDSFMYDLDRFDRDLVGGGIEAGTDPLRWPSVDEIPAHLFLAGFVEQDDRSVLALGLPVNHFLTPFPKICIVGLPHLEADV